MIGMVVNALYNIVDRIYIGNAPDLGANGLAGITIGFPIMIILIGIGVLFGIGGSTLFSIKLGQKRLDEATQVLGNAFTLLVGSGIVFMVLGQVFLTPILQVFGASATVLPYAEAYMRIIFYGAVFQAVSMGLNHFLRADGKPRLAMMTMFLGAGINILLDPLFIYGFQMGMEGAALATILSQFISMIWILSYFTSKRTHHTITLQSMKWVPSLAGRLTLYGLPMFLMQLASGLLNVVLNFQLVKYGGDLGISAMGIINSVQTFILMLVIGLNQGVNPIVSFNYGAKQYDRIREVEKQAIIIATTIVTIGFLITRFFPEQLVRLFNQDPALVDIAVHGILAWFWMLPAIGFQVIAANYFQATGHSLAALILTLSRQVLLLLPAVLLLANFFGLDGVLYAAPVADFISVILTGTWYIISIRKLGVNDTPPVEELVPAADLGV